jgi:hypothetical protein
MNKGIKGSEWSRVMAGKFEDLSPKRNAFKGTGTDLFESFLWKGAMELFLEKGDIFFHLVPNVSQSMFLGLIMDKGCVEEKDGHLKSTGLKLIPFDHGPADIIAAYQKIGFR